MRLASALFIVLCALQVSCTQQTSTEEYIQDSQKYIAEKDWKKAVISYKNAIQQTPDDADIRVALGYVYLKLFNSQAALKEFKRAIDLGVDKDKVLLGTARAYSQLGQYEVLLSESSLENNLDESSKATIHALLAKAYLRLSKVNLAKHELDKALLIDSQNIDVRLAWGQYEKFNGDIQKQRLWLAPLLEGDQQVADAWSEIAFLERSEGNIDLAESAFTKAILLRGVPHIDNLNRALLRLSINNYKGAKKDIRLLKKSGASWPMIEHIEGVIAYQEKQFDLAQELFLKVLAKSPAYSPSIRFLGLTQFNKNNYQSAIKNLKLFLTDNPEDLQANKVYITSLLRLGKHVKAIQILEPLWQKNKTDLWLTSILGNAYLSNDDFIRGIDLLTMSVKMKPANALLHFQLGLALSHSDMVKNRLSGEKELKRAIELDSLLVQADVALFKAYMREKNYIQARKIALQIIDKKQDESIGENLLALTYLAEKKPQEAVKQLKVALKKLPFDPVSSNHLARIFMDQGDLFQAKKLYKDVLSVSNNPTSLIQMSVIASKENKPEDVITWLKKAVDHNPEKITPKLLLANQYLVQNKVSSALAVLQSVTEDTKQQPSYILLMANIKIKNKEYQHAIRILKKLILKQPEKASAHLLLAQVFGLQQTYKRMRVSLEKAIELAPNYLAANLMLARLDLSEMKYDAFKKRLGLLTKYYPANKDVLFLKAKIDSNSKDYEEAVEILTSIIETSSHSEVVIDLARNYWEMGDHDSAISSLQLWMQENTVDINLLTVLAQFYLEDNRTSDAMKTFKQLDSLAPDNVTILNNIAWTLLDSDIVEGISFAEKALSLEPDNPFVHDTLAMLRLKNNEPKKALLLSTKSSKSLPNVLDIQINHARVLAANNQKKASMQLLNRLEDTATSAQQRKMIIDAIRAL